MSNDTIDTMDIMKVAETATVDPMEIPSTYVRTSPPDLEMLALTEALSSAVLCVANANTDEWRQQEAYRRHFNPYKETTVTAVVLCEREVRKQHWKNKQDAIDMRPGIQHAENAAEQANELVELCKGGTEAMEMMHQQQEGCASPLQPVVNIASVAQDRLYHRRATYKQSNPRQDTSSKPTLPVAPVALHAGGLERTLRRSLLDSNSTCHNTSESFGDVDLATGPIGQWLISFDEHIGQAANDTVETNEEQLFVCSFTRWLCNHLAFRTTLGCECINADAKPIFHHLLPEEAANKWLMSQILNHVVEQVQEACTTTIDSICKEADAISAMARATTSEFLESCLHQKKDVAGEVDEKGVSFQADMQKVIHSVCRVASRPPAVLCKYMLVEARGTLYHWDPVGPIMAQAVDVFRHLAVDTDNRDNYEMVLAWQQAYGAMIMAACGNALAELYATVQSVQDHLGQAKDYARIDSSDVRVLQRGEGLTCDEIAEATRFGVRRIELPEPEFIQPRRRTANRQFGLIARARAADASSVFVSMHSAVRFTRRARRIIRLSCAVAGVLQFGGLPRGHVSAHILLPSAKRCALNSARARDVLHEQRQSILAGSGLDDIVELFTQNAHGPYADVISEVCNAFRMFSVKSLHGVLKAPSTQRMQLCANIHYAVADRFINPISNDLGTLTVHDLLRMAIPTVERRRSLACIPYASAPHPIAEEIMSLANAQQWALQAPIDGGEDDVLVLGKMDIRPPALTKETCARMQSIANDTSVPYDRREFRWMRCNGQRSKKLLVVQSPLIMKQLRTWRKSVLQLELERQRARELLDSQLECARARAIMCAPFLVVNTEE